MPKEFIMRGRTASGGTEKLEFGGQARRGYGYRLTEFQIYPYGPLGVGTNHELCGSITAATVAAAPQTNIDFEEAGLIGNVYFSQHNDQTGATYEAVINDLFIITQDLHLMVQDQGGDGNPINWQCRFEEIKLSSSAQAVANYKQYTIFNS